MGMVGSSTHAPTCPWEVWEDMLAERCAHEQHWRSILSFVAPLVAGFDFFSVNYLNAMNTLSISNCFPAYAWRHSLLRIGS
jgi:hypothetical protein